MLKGMWQSIRPALMLAGIFVAATGAAAATQTGAPHPVEGTYDVTATGGEIGTIKYIMKLRREGGKWVGEVTDAPFPMTINTVSVDADNKISMSATAGEATATITGKFDAGKLAGDWTAGDATGTWSALKQEAVAAAPATSATATAAPAGEVEGTYDAEIVADGQGTLPFTLIVKRNGEKYETEVKDGGDINIVSIDLKGEEVTLGASYQGNPFPLPGKRAGKDMGGKWEAGGFTGTWSAKKRAGN
jgi:hypothetical protein